MSFRTRLFLAFALAVLVPLGVLAFGMRREMDRRLAAEYRGRVDAAVEAIRADLARESWSLQGRLGALGAQLAGDNRFRQAAVQGDPGARGYLLDWARYAIRQAGFTVLQLQDSSGRILSSGHFRNEYDRLRPELPRFLAGGGGWPALARMRTPEGPVLALVRSDSFTVGGRRFTLVGGIAAEKRFFGRSPGDSTLSVRLAIGDSAAAAPAGSEVVGELRLPYLDLPPATTGGTARLVVSQSAGTLLGLRRGLDRWLLAALLATAVVAIAGAAWLSSRISRPLTRLAEQTAAIDLDRLDQDFTSERGDEIGSLSRLLGAMTGRLRTGAARLREAERRVAMGDLARQVNHDIKNGLVPIRNVLAHLDEVARDRPGALVEVFTERRGTLDSSVAYLDTLARNYARLSPAAAPEACDVNALVSELVGTGHGGAVRTALADALPPAAADRLMLRRVLENLIGNAVDSLDGAAGGVVTVSTELLSRPGGASAVRITVADTGRGMSRAELERAFDDFFTTKPGGTGLGLSIVRRLVLDLGGALRIDTEPGAGTRAVVELPARAGEAVGG